ncbi:MAG: glucosamine-6-phosphate deaminase, partial [Rhodothermales bacterium]|nr:glucosamine-6-phosphate deaminase [Rhodothermales bacterium]
LWLSEKLNKAVLKLTNEDYNEYGMGNLIAEIGSAEHINLKVFNQLQATITGWPGGKPNADDSQRPERRAPYPKRSLIFSPHPDDDVISMGGMLGKLVSNGNDVTVAYMTNGSVAVFDQDVTRHLRFVEMTYSVLAGAQPAESFVHRSDEILEFLEDKAPGQVDSEAVQKIKAFIRYTEALAAIEVMGLSEENARFLDLPFYKTGRVKKDPIGPDDVAIILELFNELEPDEIFVAGDLSDPHGTHRMCYAAIDQALRKLDGQRQEWQKSGDGATGGLTGPRVWLYRGAWQEWEIDRADVFVPLTKAELDRKIEAIYKHESQKDRALFPGAYDVREFWQRARDRNVETAKRLDALGLPEFHAAEAYVTCYEMP